MGACTSKKLPKGDAEKAINRSWMKESGYIDKFVYETKIKQNDYLHLQQQLLLNCTRLDYMLDPTIEESGTINMYFIQRNKRILIKGVPNYFFTDFLFCIFSMKKAEYSTIKDSYFTEEENEKLKGIDKCLFGRNKITSNFLNTEGIKSMDKILYLLREEFPILQYCPILPKVIQLLLWFVPEKIALKMGGTLLNENGKTDTIHGFERTSKSSGIKYFSTSIKTTKGLKNFARGMCKVLADKKVANSILEDLIDNMCLQVIPPEYIPIVFAGYLVNGIQFVANLAGIIYSRFSNDASKDIAQISAELSKERIHEYILRAHRFNNQVTLAVGSNESKMSEMYSTYAPMADKASKILPTNENKNQIFALIPKIHQYGQMKRAFSFEQNGLLIKELDYFWKKPCLASILLIQTEVKIYGLYIDREILLLEGGISNTQSSLFIYDKNIRLFNHIPSTNLFYSYSIRTGINIGGSEVFTIHLDSSLLEFELNNESTFGNTKEDDTIPEGKFDVTNIELFLLR